MNERSKLKQQSEFSGYTYLYDTRSHSLQTVSSRMSNGSTPSDIENRYPTKITLPTDLSSAKLHITSSTCGSTPQVDIQINPRLQNDGRFYFRGLAQIGQQPDLTNTIEGEIENRIWGNYTQNVLALTSTSIIPKSQTLPEIKYIYLDLDLSAYLEKVLQQKELEIARNYDQLNNWEGQVNNQSPLIYNPVLEAKDDQKYSHHSNLVVTDEGSHSQTTNLFLQAAAITGADNCCRYQGNRTPAAVISVPPSVECDSSITFEEIISKHPHLRPTEIRDEFDRLRGVYYDELLDQGRAYCSRDSAPARKISDRATSIKDLSTTSIPESIIQALPASSHPEADSETVPASSPRGRLIKKLDEDDTNPEVGDETVTEISDFNDETMPVSTDAFELLSYTRRYENLVEAPGETDKSEIGPYRYYAQVTLVYCGEIFIDCYITARQWGEHELYLHQQAMFPDKLIQAVERFLFSNSPVPLWSPRDLVDDPYEPAPLPHIFDLYAKG